MQDETVRERLAAYAHDAWTGWMKYLFSKSTSNSDGTVTIHKWAVNRWKMQVETSYKDLPEEMKESDRKEADRMLAIVGESDAFAICAFRELREAWFNAHLKKDAHEREWENEKAEDRRKTDNAELKIKFDLQTEQIIKGIKKPISPTCHHDMTKERNNHEIDERIFEVREEGV